MRIEVLWVDADVPSVQRYLGAHASLSHALRAATERPELVAVEALSTLVVIDARACEEYLDRSDGRRRAAPRRWAALAVTPEPR